MNITEFIIKEKDQLTFFQEWWEQNAEFEPSDYAEWSEQFNLWKDEQ